MTKKILYITEQKSDIPENAFLLTKNCFSNIEKLKNQNIYCWLGDMDTLVSAVSTLGVEKGIILLNELLDGVVAEIKNEKCIHYTCNAVMMHCCAGAYIRIVNKTNI